MHLDFPSPQQQQDGGRSPTSNFPPVLHWGADLACALCASFVPIQPALSAVLQGISSSCGSCTCSPRHAIWCIVVLPAAHAACSTSQDLPPSAPHTASHALWATGRRMLAVDLVFLVGALLCSAGAHMLWWPAVGRMLKDGAMMTMLSRTMLLTLLVAGSSLVGSTHR